MALNPIVVKLGGEVVRANTSPLDTLSVVCRDLAALAASGQAVIVIHGGGPQATDLQKRTRSTS
jgi:acetylglutamate kinase